LVVHDTTGVTGTFSLNVPFGGYTIEAALDNHIFGYPATGQVVNVAPGQVVNFGAIQAKTAMARGVSAMRVTDTTTVAGVSTYTGSVTVTWTDSGEDVPPGYSAAVYTIETNTGADGAWEGADGAALAGGDTTGLGRFTAGADDDGELMVRVVATAAADGSVTDITDPLVLNSVPATLAAVDPSVSDVMARLAVTDTTVNDTMAVTWDATSNARSAFRVVVQLAPASLGGTTLWFVAEGGSTVDANARSWTLDFVHRATVNWDVAVNGGAVDVAITTAELRAATMVRVESLQGTFDADDNPWKPSAEVAVTGGS
ncbi:MAG: hypothetical protein OXH08_10150, partial [Gammaproteobacteria bacterium]|nr:hypothetical protein [Gammaproteobacteria bacterium]